ncbi:MAG: GspH/FimT family pseudopilin [Nitrospirae bacterium]|nr:GspH/FimT family pseudopilin [Candidatus Troglogloeales bacterium]
MVTIAIVAILVTVAVPSFQNSIAKENLKDCIVNLKGALQIARMNAMATTMPVAVSLVNATTMPVAVSLDNDPNNQLVGQFQVFIDNGTGGGTARDGIWNGGEVTISPQGRQLAAGEAANAVQNCKGNTMFVPTPQPQPNNDAPTPPAIEFLSSGRRFLPGGPQDVSITLQNGFGLANTITVSAIGDIR